MRTMLIYGATGKAGLGRGRGLGPLVIRRSAGPRSDSSTRASGRWWSSRPGQQATTTSGATSTTTVTLENTSQACAFFARAQVLSSSGTEILPVLWNEPQPRGPS